MCYLVHWDDGATRGQKWIMKLRGLMQKKEKNKRKEKESLEKKNFR